MSGFEERTVPAGEVRPRNAGVTGRDSRDFPGFTRRGSAASLSAITPGTVEHWLRNEYYQDAESFLAAIADVLHEEYKTITGAGLLLQVDDQPAARARVGRLAGREAP
jgi:hypothetical protein